jgi:NAD(P)H-hydrate epimerase
MKLVTAAEMRALEEKAFVAGETVAGLMENAGRAVAQAIRDEFGVVRARRIVILVGPGNNGGDGLVAARHLHDFGADLTVALLAPRPEEENLQHVRSRGMTVIEPGDEQSLEEALERADAVVDAVLGTGRARPLEGSIANILAKIHDLRVARFAIDLPSGLDADSGAIDPHAARADVTLTLGVSKIGLHLLPGATYAGRVQVLDIGLDPALSESIATELLTPESVRAHLPGRPAESNKGTFGRVLVVAGSANYTGAPALASLGALRTGAGLVTLASTSPARAAIAALLPEATYLPLPEADGVIASSAGDVIVRALPAYDALLIGPGLGLAAGTQALVRSLVSSPGLESIPVVIDADGLNALSRWPVWWEEARCHAVLTPHPGELARLTGTSIAETQQDRLATARHCAEAWRQVVVLKGAHTVIANPDGRALISPFANAALATAGTGDVLAGAISGLLAQGVEPFQAAGAGVYLHGAAASLFEADYGASGLLASELAAGIARVAARLRRNE